MNQRNGYHGGPTTAALGGTCLNFRVYVDPGEGQFRSRLEAFGANWSTEQGCFLLEMNPMDPQGALEAIEAVAERIAALAHGWLPPTLPLHALSSETDLGEAQVALLAHYAQSLGRRKYSASTLKNYKKAFRTFLQEIAPALPLDLNKEQVEAWLERHCRSKACSTAHQNTIINAVKIYYTVVEDLRLNDWDIRRPKQETPVPVTLTKAEVQRLLASTTNIKHRCLLLVAYSTGLRLNEVLSLRVSDLDLDRMTITIHTTVRGRCSRSVPLSPKLAEAFKGYFEEFNPLQWLFEGERRGQPYSERSAQMAVRLAADRAQLPQSVSMQLLRNSYARHQLEAGIAVDALQDLMGHQSIRTTHRYAHVARHKMPSTPIDDMDV